MNLHPYDGKERRFQHTDAETEAGLAIVAQILGLPSVSAIDRVFYSLSFYSGGMGILDRLAITMQAERSIWTTVIETHQAKTLEQANQDAEWVDELVWLFDGEETAMSLAVDELAVQFINSKRHVFQPQCRLSHRILFADGSGVNWWVALWGEETTLSMLSYDQG